MEEEAVTSQHYFTAETIGPTQTIILISPVSDTENIRQRRVSFSKFVSNHFVGEELAAGETDAIL